MEFVKEWIKLLYLVCCWFHEPYLLGIFYGDFEELVFRLVCRCLTKYPPVARSLNFSIITKVFPLLGARGRFHLFKTPSDRTGYKSLGSGELCLISEEKKNACD